MKTNHESVRKHRIVRGIPCRAGIVRRVDLFVTERRLERFIDFMDAGSRVLGWAAVIAALFFILLPTLFHLWTGR